ncbi:MAG: hypothetical protein H6736_02335 [Alphaproteobacteria bacterium]|nr:hypothetical protein [Alphaproteobacteria bacterium]MCB9690629.1 hypothetical protein [Alphaproteobacteria bacterium]
MTRLLALSTVALLACQPPPQAAAGPAPSSKRVIELYMHQNGLSRCVEQDGERWKADASCCPDGYDMAGFSVPAAVEYPKDDGVKRTLYRHVVCIER